MNKQLVKVEIRCPFCLENTNKWKKFWCHYVTYDVHFIDVDGICKIKKRTTQELIDEKLGKAFETKILREHFNVCSMKLSISFQVKTSYNI